MSERITLSGHCLCGSVSFSVEAESRQVSACHCSMCRRWGGGPLMVLDCGQVINFTHEENIQVYDSSDWAERGFCNSCGSHLFYRYKPTQQHMVPVGLFENQEGWDFNLEVYIDNKPTFYSFSNTTEQLTEKEVLAAFGHP